MRRNLFLLLGILCFFSGSPVFADLPVVHIAVIEDGPAMRYGGIAELKAEILDLTKNEFDVRFPETLHFSGSWDVKEIGRQVERALTNPVTDIVIAAGVISSHLLCHRDNLQKPAIASLVIDANLQNLPESQGSSGVRNLNYIKSFQNFDRDMEAFGRMVPFKRLALIGDETIVAGLPDLAERTKSAGKKFGVEIDFIAATSRASHVLASLPESVDAVFITPLMRFSHDEFALLIQGLEEKKLPSFSLWGRDEVERGILAGMAPSERINRLSRRISLHVQQILLGRDAGSLSVAFHPDMDFTVNMETARRIGVYPDWDILLDADLIHEDPHPIGRPLAINGAVQAALSANLEIRLAEREEAIRKALARSQRSPLRPQGLFSLEGRVTDSKNAASSMGRQPEEEIWAEVMLRQILFSEKKRSVADVADIELKTQQVMRRQVELDIAESAALAFLDVLRAGRLVQIRKDDLDLSRANLERAENRREVGYAGPSEVYRWQSRLASARKALLEARSLLRQAETGLNLILNRPLDQPVFLSDTRLSDPLFFVSDPRIRWFSENPGRMGVFHDFVVAEARDQAPELERVELAMEAARRGILAARRSWYLPDLLAEGGMRQRLLSQGKGSGAAEIELMPGVPPIRLPESEDFGWQVGIKASYPLITGGARPAALDEGLERLESLRTRRLQIAEGLEARMRVSLHRTTASWPGIRLSADAAAAASKNLELVTDAYERGLVSAMELLDAQHASLVAEQMSATSVYDFLKDLMAVQRLLGNVDFSATLEARDAMFERLKRHFEDSGMDLPLVSAGGGEE
ncbi:TolC family protein [Desulfobotulus mexicanus]|uniref:TolC family protein n=1 Tax=Desulfobotulus mexicanus TaxID=2586642 RepID=A0A5Q4VEW5_9BACT|nr:TolC family protein [Desulfobotulus mexicanus]TYT76229.1 hypothetical protein FIM25_01370 [Desulfobotulus mexicanus]